MKKITLFILVNLFLIVPSLAQKKTNIAGIAIYGKVDSLISQMTLEEKIDQLSGMGVSQSEFGDKNVSVFGTRGNKRLNIPDLIMGHGITGVRTGRDRGVHATYFCTPIAIGSSWDIELYYRIGTAMAKEMRALNQNLNLGPTVNIIRHPLGGRNWECFSEDPYLTSRMIVPYVKSMQDKGIICGPKHFVTNNQEKHRFDINNIVDLRTMREIYLPAFKASVVEGGALNIMGAYNRLNGTFMCEHEYYLTDILRNEWGFKGFVLSDFGNGVRSTHGAVKAGLNIEMHSTKFYGKSILQAVKNNEISENRINELLREKLFVMYNIGMFDNDYPAFPESIVHCQEHQKIALEVARKAPVLMKNEDNILPIDIKKVKSIAVIGPNAKRFPNYKPYEEEYAYYLQGGGSGRCYYFVESVVSPYQGIQNISGNKIKIYYSQGCRTPFKNDQTDDEVLMNEAVELAQKSDLVILVLGLSGFNESEGWDRKSANLPGKQDELIERIVEVNPNIVLVLIAGCYIEMGKWHKKIPGILFCPYAGEKIGKGIAEVLFGQKNPEGKLPFSYPYSVSQYPEGSIYTGEAFYTSGKSNVYSEGIFVGYRYFEKNKVNIMFPFGHGLSYTSFKYDDLEVLENLKEDSVLVTFSVLNSGKREGAEVTQLYIEDEKASVDRPVKELKRFKKVYLKSNESKKVIFILNQSDLAYYDIESKRWEVEAGKFNILIGSSLDDIRLKGSFDYQKDL